MKVYKCLTWNVEGFCRSKFPLKDLTDSMDPDFLFLSEPMLYQCDILHETSLFSPNYRSALSSDDIFDSELPFLRRRAKGGVMILWKKELDQFVTLLPSPLLV